MQRVVAYVRVSTDEQYTANQLPELAALAERRGWQIERTYEETESAKKKRPVFERLMSDARAHRFDVLLVWALDRLQRSQLGAMMTLYELDKLGVRTVSSQESWLDVEGPARSLLISIIGWVAEQEHARIVERTRIGMARVKLHGSKSGKPIGRPRASPIMLGSAADEVARGRSIRSAAKLAGMKEATLRRFLSRLAVAGAETPALAPTVRQKGA